MFKRNLLLVSGYFFCSELFANCSENLPQAGMAECEYSAFSVWMSCKHKAAVLSWATIEQDSGSQNTSNRHTSLDPSAIPLHCQQNSVASYKTGSADYDAGYLTAIDLFDYDKNVAQQANVMTNIVPQATLFKRFGAWKRTELLAECYRDEEGYSPLLILSGVIFGNDLSNDNFSASHGLPKTPDYFWKLIYSESKNSYDAWIMQNSNSAKIPTLKASRKDLSSLIIVLKSQADEDYLPVIKKLMRVGNDATKFEEWVYRSSCHHRKG
ncbi:MAG: endonuclease G [Paraglaciecola sp.]|jgi:endonuclease G